MRDGFSVGEPADSGQQYAGYAWRDAIGTARTDHVPIVYPRAGMVWQTDDGVTLTFIGPSLPFIESSNDQRQFGRVHSEVRASNNPAPKAVLNGPLSPEQQYAIGVDAGANVYIGFNGSIGVWPPISSWLSGGGTPPTRIIGLSDYIHFTSFVIH